MTKLQTVEMKGIIYMRNTRNVNTPFLVLVLVLVAAFFLWECGAIDYAINSFETGRTGAQLRGMGMIP